jgi:AmiR/NasT family two-component response regulator
MRPEPDDPETEVEQLREALEHRTTIGEALGIIMERLGITDEQALRYLKRLSQSHNVKVHDLAALIVETRVLPGQGGLPEAESL